jgi:hypothetical protein
MGESALMSFVWLWVFACTLLPAVLVAFSRRTAGGERVLWTLAVLFTSWLGFVAFMIATSQRPRDASGASKRSARRYVSRGIDISDHRPG